MVSVVSCVQKSKLRASAATSATKVFGHWCVPPWVNSKNSLPPLKCALLDLRKLPPPGLFDIDLVNLYDVASQGLL